MKKTLFVGFGSMMVPVNSPDIRIYLLGRFEIIRGNKTLRANNWNRHKAAALLKRLAWERKLLKEVVVDHLWPDASLTSGSNNLYRSLHEIRRTLDTHLGIGSADQIVTFSDGILTLSDSVWVDAHEYENAAKNANTQYLIANYAGDFLPDDLYEDWTQTPRGLLFQFYEEALLSHAEADPGIAIGLLPPLLSRDPLDEPIHRALIRAYALTGRRHDALRQFQTCKDILDAELGISPDPQTMRLYDQILQGELLARPREPTLTTPVDLPFTPLQIELGTSLPFIGRREELESLLQRIRTAGSSNGDMILLAGDTGVGKTRLAYEILQGAVSSGMNALLGACYEQEGQLPYQPFIEAFNRYLSNNNLPHNQNPVLNFKKSGVTDPQQEQ